MHEQATLIFMRHGLYQGRYSTLIVVEFALTGGLTFHATSVIMNIRGVDARTLAYLPSDGSKKVNSIQWEDRSSVRSYQDNQSRIAFLIAHGGEWFHTCLSFHPYKYQRPLLTLERGLTIRPVKNNQELRMADLKAHDPE